MLVNERAERALLRELRPGVSVSREYMEQLNGKVCDIVTGHARVNGGKRTLKADVFLGMPARGARRK